VPGPGVTRYDLGASLSKQQENFYQPVLTIAPLFALNIDYTWDFYNLILHYIIFGPYIDFIRPVLLLPLFFTKAQKD
jgi:hypothetical protein